MHEFVGIHPFADRIGLTSEAFAGIARRADDLELSCRFLDHFVSRATVRVDDLLRLSLRDAEIERLTAENIELAKQVPTTTGATPTSDYHGA